MTTKLVLSAPLPRVYEDTGNGRVVPTPSDNGPEPESNRIGGDFKVEELTRVSRETVRLLMMPAMHSLQESSALRCNATH